MKIVRQVAWSVGLLIAGVACSACGNGVEGPSSTQAPLTTQQQKEDAGLKMGVNPVKAKSGGGLVPQPKENTPGEHIGMPDAGTKAGAGG